MKVYICERAGEEIKDRDDNPTGKILGLIESPLVIAVQLNFTVSSFELLPDA